MNESNGDITVSSHLKMISGLVGSSFPTKYLEGSDLHGGMNSQISSVSIPYSLQNPHKLADINMYSTHLVGTGLKNDSSSKDEAPLNRLEDTLTNSHMLSRCCDEAHSLLDAKPTSNNLAPRKGRLDDDLFQALNNPVTHLDQHMLSGQIHGFVTDCQTSDYGNTSSNSVDAKFEDGCMRPPSGDDLLDNLGADFKKKLLIGKWNNLPADEQRMGEVNMSNLVESELYGLTKSLAKAGTMGSSSFQYGCSKDDGGNRSQTTSIYGSHISSWVEHGQSMRHDGSVSTAHSKKKDETTKSNRKRMIQDQVKELREIVPNGAKCSIDALLERTIKHMLFLQSVTKHADKLKQTGESKIISKEGGLLLKEKFEGGATWAFEVGLQSMVCRIIVEDLNPPRQLLVEMLCEEQGFFLEIADFIRVLGLTILKGVMEARNDKIWARFAVEANRDVTRMEIFMSLVLLLDQTVKGSTLANALTT